LVASYDLQSGNGAGLSSKEKISNAKSEEKRIGGEAYNVNKQTIYHHHTTTVLRPFFWDHPGEPVPEKNFWNLCCNGR